RTLEETLENAQKLGYPVMLRPSFVLSGTAMRICHSDEDVREYAGYALSVAGDGSLFLDRYLSDAIEVDVDALCDGQNVHVAGIMEHIEEAGVHSGDSACALPPYTLSPSIIGRLSEQTIALAKALNVCGLINIQYAVKEDEIYVLEANPRASRTVPFVAKAVGAPIAGIAAKIMGGKALPDFDLRHAEANRVAVKEAVFPFARFANVDPILGPEMRSTGEVMGWDDDFGTAFLKAQIGAGEDIPETGTAFISLREADKPEIVEAAKDLSEMGFELVATSGTAAFLDAHGISARTVKKVLEGKPNIEDAILNGEIDMVLNTTEGAQSRKDSKSIRRTALIQNVPYFTTLSACRAAVKAIRARREKPLSVQALQKA
ncbi:MAG: carbamoyl phosphate synthase large subunit, partial [Pseudomonadota bacterium]